ncbi:dachshund homolog 1-like isoform X2 [Ornithodoros turicata]|uniref:dachshund homolog 1-like isoform X2 n=1 Tax=Ornithodoros turicata TaxID=34597 RepID=UPI003139CF61
MDATSTGSATPSPPTLTFGAQPSPDPAGRGSPKSGLGSRSTPESPIGASLPPPPPLGPKPFGVPSSALHALNGRPPYAHPRAPPSPPGIPSDASATDCRLIDYRGAKVAAFYVNGEYLLCLPQAFELFLKHLVGGLHTVYTKLKRLDITPIVCNVEQVRILRGLGAIQPGVNRCKLLSCKDFDSLYKDCTTARSASRLWNAASLVGTGSSPANARCPSELSTTFISQVRPPKRSSMTSLSPNNGTPIGMLNKKGRLDDYAGYENGHMIGDRGDKPPSSGLLPNGFNAQQAAAAAAAHLNATLPFLAMGAHPGGHPGLLGAAMGYPLPGSTPHHTMASPASTRPDGKPAAVPGHIDPQAALRLRDDPSGGKDRGYSSYDGSRGKDSAVFVNGGIPTSVSNGHGPPVLNLSQHASRNDDMRDFSDNAAADADDDTEDDGDTDDRDQELSGGEASSPDPQGADQRYADSGALGLNAVSSIETLLRNIQGLLKVAADNARHQDRQISIEKAELKMEVLRERGLRENLEKQLAEEQRTRVLYQKRLKKERRCRRRIQDQLELEQKKRSQYEEVLRTTASLPSSTEHRSPSAATDRVTSSDTENDRPTRQEQDKKDAAAAPIL